MNSRYRLPLLLTLLGGFGLRLYRLGAESLWYDETVSVVLAQKTIPNLIAHTAGDIHPPGYYLLLHLWGWITTPTLDTGLEFLYAWPSLWFGLLILPLLYQIGRRLHSARVGLIAVVLAAINPYHLWYSQEVRMYTLGAFLGLLCLCCLIKFWGLGTHTPTSTRPETDAPLGTLPAIQKSSGTLFGYALAAAAGLYSLYYFAFTLIGLNVIALCCFVWQMRAARGQNGSTHLFKMAAQWVAAQVAVLAIWSPWLPVFWRQATDPPVPPWRKAWTLAQFGQDLLESGSALVGGQTLAGWLVPLAACTGLWVISLYGIWGSLGNERKLGRLAILLYLLLPILVIFVLTVVVTPLYHVRYLFTYAPVFLIAVGAVIARMATHSRLLPGFAMLLFTALSAYGLVRFWTVSEYQADDHRGAVATLAKEWRPSDLILVNAGWAYTPLELYWPTSQNTASGPSSSLPPSLTATKRLLDLPLVEDESELGFGQQPLLVRTGSVDSTDNLGWGDPRSDFFAITSAEAAAALDQLATCYDRIWHYRIYDTVSDPTGEIRNWLNENGELRSERSISGRDLGQLQLYEIVQGEKSGVAPSFDCSPTFRAWSPVDFGGALSLENVATPTELPSGQTLYVTLDWQPLPALADEPSPLSMSLRLYPIIGAGPPEEPAHDPLAQQDEAPGAVSGYSTDLWLSNYGASITDGPNHLVRQRLALPLPREIPPGDYTLELIVYRQLDGTPLTLPEVENTTWGQRLRVTFVKILAGK